ncbi:MAG: diphthine synthase [Candidatus Woesearchaeota archaeon]|nr:diphthine synthase [Candidatus Woesearchaeota archaeon]
MLYLIGLGLCDGNDITLRGKEAISSCAAVYIESYTSLLQCTHAALEQQLGCTITQLTRTAVEQEIGPILERAQNEDIAILVIGDPFGATTHTDLYLRAKKHSVPVQVIHNASIMNAIGALGLELYRYGKTVSIPYWEKNFEPRSYIDGITENLSRGLHTLCLLDIKAEQEKYMTIPEGIAYLEKELDDTMVIGVARLGCPDQYIAVGRLSTLKDVDFGRPPHTLVLPGKLHPIEEEMLEQWEQYL